MRDQNMWTTSERKNSFRMLMAFGTASLAMEHFQVTFLPFASWRGLHESV